MGRLVGSAWCVGLGKPVARVGHGEGSVRPGRRLDPIGLAVMRGRRRRVGAGGRSRDRRDRHGGGGVVQQIGNEHARHCVFLPAQLREMHLPQVFEARR